MVECDASEVCVSATLNQRGRPVAFMSRTLQGSELHYPPVEREATAIIEAGRKWRNFFAGRHFTLVTDQRSVAFMIDNRKRSKIKNNKIQSWRLELASFSYTVKYLSSPRICLTPNGRLSFQMLCISSDRSPRHRQTQPCMRHSSASSVAHPVTH